MCAHIVLVHGNSGQAELLRYYVESANHTVTLVSDGSDAIDITRRERPGLVLLDIVVPEVDGLDMLRGLRAESEVPVIVMSAPCSEDHRVLYLDLGADDYVTHSCGPRELLARMRAVLRRTRAHCGPDDSVFEVGGLTVDRHRHVVLCNGALVDCTPGEFRLLETLAAEPNQVLTRQQLLERQDARCATSRTIDMHVVNLRKKIECDPGRPRRLVTVYGVGYKLVGRPS
jgi:DNA-binding response OmpR family regulator